MRFLGKYWKWIVGVIVLVLVVAIGGFVFWAGTPAGATMPTALIALESNDTVTVTQDDWIVFEPVSGTATAGFIFYPGGRVLADSYAPLGQAIAEDGYLAVLVPMPLNLAVFNAEAANDVIAQYPSVEHWAIGGHSLGGSMAARYAYNNPDAVDGLVMMGAFPEEQFDFTERDLVVASIYGDLDGLATVDEIDASVAQLPDSADFVLIEGGNHAQFGWYGEQSGDNPATISREEQYEQVVSATLGVLEQISD